MFPVISFYNSSGILRSAMYVAFNCKDFPFEYINLESYWLLLFINIYKYL